MSTDMGNRTASGKKADKADMDRAVQQHREALLSQYWLKVRNESVGKNLLVVEGDDDRAVIESLLEWRSSGLWSGKVTVAVAGDRNKVLDKLEANPSWYGLVDRDVWDVSDEQSQKSKYSRLTITSGWCIENHFCVPSALALALGIDEVALRNAIDSKIPGWFRHGAIWWVVHRFRGDLMKSWPSSDCGHPEKGACPDDAALRAALVAYDQLLPRISVDNIVAAVNQRERDVAAMASDEDRMEKAVHGKLFFKEVVVKILNRGHRQHDTATWRVRIASAMANQWPQYLVDFADQLLRP